MTIEMHEMSQEEEDRLWDIVDNYTLKPNIMFNYDEQIEMLTKDPQRIPSEWTSARGLFKMITGHSSYDACLTMIRNGMLTFPGNGVTQEIIDEIKRDERIPKDPMLITPEHFPIFKEWQERIDKLKPA